MAIERFSSFTSAVLLIGAIASVNAHPFASSGVHPPQLTFAVAERYARAWHGQLPQVA